MMIHFLGPHGDDEQRRCIANRFAERLRVAGDAARRAAVASHEQQKEQLERRRLPQSRGCRSITSSYGLITETLRTASARATKRIQAGLKRPNSMAAGSESGRRGDAAQRFLPRQTPVCVSARSTWLTLHPVRERVAVASTAEGIEQALAQGGVALASADALSVRGMTILVEDATNDYLGRTNYTEFVLLTTAEQKALTLPASDDHRCLLVCDPQDDRPGLLAGMLAQLAFFHLNLARIHARPARVATQTELDPQIFFLEIAGKLGVRERELLLDALAIGLSGNVHSNPKLLGEYPLYDLSGDA